MKPFQRKHFNYLLLLWIKVERERKTMSCRFKSTKRSKQNNNEFNLRTANQTKILSKYSILLNICLTCLS